MTTTAQPGPSLADIVAAAEQIANRTLHTPVLPLTSDRWAGRLPEGADVQVKLELYQQAGSFKARGALLGILGLAPEQRAAGVVAASGGNHALAVSWAAQAAGVSAFIAMPEATDPLRIDGCRQMGAEVELCETIGHAFDRMNDVAAAQGRTLMHPFEGAHMTLGSAVIGAEYHRQAPDADVYVIPVGGGGLIGGMACAIKQLNPAATVIGVEPSGADSLTRSLAAGAPVRLDAVQTIADSLGAPLAMPYSFAVAQAFVDETVIIEDADMVEGMRVYQETLRLTAEPACAASLAAIMGPLKHRLAGRSVAIIACGSNIGLPRYLSLLGSS